MIDLTRDRITLHFRAQAEISGRWVRLEITRVEIAGGILSIEAAYQLPASAEPAVVTRFRVGDSSGLFHHCQSCHLPILPGGLFRIEHRAWAEGNDPD